jgi:hypothetical protein
MNCPRCIEDEVPLDIIKSTGTYEDDENLGTFDHDVKMKCRKCKRRFSVLFIMQAMYEEQKDGITERIDLEALK